MFKNNLLGKWTSLQTGTQHEKRMIVVPVLGVKIAGWVLFVCCIMMTGRLSNTELKRQSAQLARIRQWRSDA